MSISEQKNQSRTGQSIDGPEANLKDKIEKLINSNVYCWTVIGVATAGIIMQFLYHEGTKYSDKFFIVLAIMLLAIGVNIFQLRKNYLKKRQQSRP